jgi:predicted transcriptional regulator of viral defense system
MTAKEKALLARLERDGGEGETEDETLIRGLELRGLVTRLGQGKVRLIKQEIEKAPSEKIAAFKAALREGSKSRAEALAFLGDARLLWLATLDEEVLRLDSGDYAIVGGPMRPWSKRKMAEVVRLAMPKGVAVRAMEIIRQTGLPDKSVRNLLAQMIESGEITRVGMGVYVR